MSRHRYRHTLLFVSALLSCGLMYTGHADTTINPVNKYAYGANIGWVNWQGDLNNGAVLGQFFCTGFVYAANCGWINLGNGPTNGVAYSNAAADDFGVNLDGTGTLRGFAYGANIGWVQFENQGDPKVDLLTGNLSGFAYGANVGWIGLSNNFAHVQTDQLDPGPDSDGDGIPDAWEYSQVGNLSDLKGDGDLDGDGVPDPDEYGADTNPDNINEFLQITDGEIAQGGVTSIVTWASQPSRLYVVQSSESTSNGTVWADAGLGIVPPDAGASTTRGVNEPTPITNRFYRVKAVVPLSP